MRGIKFVNVGDNERALLFRRKRLERVLVPGHYTFIDPLNRLRIELYDIAAKRDLQHPMGKFLATTYAAQTASELDSYQLADDEVGLVFQGSNLVDLLPPGSFRLYWKGPEAIRVERLNIAETLRVPQRLLPQLKALPVANRLITGTEVAEQHVGLLYVDGERQLMLAPGSYGFWCGRQHVVIRHVDLRLQNVEVNGQEILTRDRVSLRLNLLAVYRVVDVDAAVTRLNDFSDFLYRELQLQLREAVGTRSLDELLANKDSLNSEIAEGIRERVAEFGLEVKSVGVRDIILPGEMKTILNQVVEAEKEAEANLIRRREETAATRSLHNTAKMMEGNPTLMRLKELEVLEKVTERIGTLTVHSGLEGVLKDIIKLPTMV